jgi:hypothetical protein
MSPASAGQADLAETYQSDQRLHQRYPIALDVEYRLLSRGRVERLGSGRTLNISSGGVLIEVHDPMPSGGPIELVMHWPFLLEGVCPLKLVMRGRIVRSDGRAIAIKAKHHEFRTAGARVPKGRASYERVRSLGR